jgi:hypothetical protein
MSKTIYLSCRVKDALIADVVKHILSGYQPLGKLYRDIEGDWPGGCYFSYYQAVTTHKLLFNENLHKQQKRGSATSSKRL